MPTATDAAMAAARPRPAEEASRRRRETARFLPLLGGAFVAAHAAAGAISITTAEPAFEFVLHLAVSIGIIASLLSVRTGRSVSFAGSVVMVASFVAYALRMREGLPLVGLMYPPEVIADEEISLSTLVAWFLVGFAFMQARRENLVFVFVPGLTVFGLMATRNLNPEFLLAFMLFLLASVFCWGYDHFLQEASRMRREVDWRGWARAHLSRAVLVFALAALGGVALGNALYHTTPRMYTGFGFQPRILNWAGAQVSGYFMFREGFQIGNGPIRLSPSPVLRVRANETHLWGGRKYDSYTGGGWTRSRKALRRVERVEGTRAYNVRKPAPVEPPSPPTPPLLWLQGEIPLTPPDLQPARPPAVLPRLDDAATWEFEPLRGREFRAEMEVLGSSTTGVFGAPHPYRLAFGPPRSTIDPARRAAVSTDSYGALQTTMQMEMGQTYTVWSRLPEFSPEGLRSAPQASHDDDFREQYIEQISIEAATALGPLVESITAQAVTDYDRVMAIKQYLETKFLYTLDVPYTPRGQDPVVYFVKVTRRGACDLFASAMTLMCRLAGVPSRVATGFNRGEWDPQQQAFIVRGEHAHAWSEVYFPGFGWVPFDPSAAEALERQSLADLLRLGQWQLLTRGAARTAVWALLIGAGLYLVLTALVDPRPYVGALRRRWRSRRVPGRLLAADYEGLLRLLARRSRVRYRPAMTPLQLIDGAAEALLMRRDPELCSSLRAVTERFYGARYGPPLAADAIADLRQETARLRRRVRRM